MFPKLWENYTSRPLVVNRLFGFEFKKYLKFMRTVRSSLIYINLYEKKQKILQKISRKLKN